ncbi:MAG: hypothetical protein KAH17_03085 [Bacteroidales bacterium]|nr:hypothetical protein [Bacteroidales bacterium]
MRTKQYAAFKVANKELGWGKAVVEKLAHRNHLAIKDHYTFDFMELSEKHCERELEVLHRLAVI